MARKPRVTEPPLAPTTAAAWQHLLDIATDLREMSPWEHVGANAILGVRDPDSGEIDWCNVLGHNREVFGVAMYGGDAGYETLHRIQDDEVDEFDAAISQRCVTLIFGSSADLLPATKKLWKTLGRSFRGATNWPEFLVHEPGFMPVPPTSAAQLERLANTLCGIASLVPWAHDDPDGGDCQVPHHAWVTKPPFTEDCRQPTRLPAVTPIAALSPPPFDQLTVNRLRHNSTPRRGRWLVDWFAGIGIIDGPEAKGRPYFTAHLFVFEIDSGMMIAIDIGRVGDVAADLQGLLLKACTQHGLPAELGVRRQDLAAALQPFAKELGVPLSHQPDLATVTEQVYSNMLGFLHG